MKCNLSKHSYYKVLQYVNSKNVNTFISHFKKCLKIPQLLPSIYIQDWVLFFTKYFPEVFSNFLDNGPLSKLPSPMHSNNSPTPNGCLTISFKSDIMWTPGVEGSAPKDCPHFRWQPQAQEPCALLMNQPDYKFGGFNDPPLQV